MTPTRHTLVAVLAITAAAFGVTSGAAQAAGTRAGATRAATRHVVTYVKRYGVVLRTSELDLQCSSVGRSRWKCFVYANGGQCTGTLDRGVLDTRTDLPGAGHRHRLRRITVAPERRATAGPRASVRRHSAGTDAGSAAG